MPFILEERADRRPNFCTAVLNYSIRVVGDNAVIPEFPVRMGSSTVTSSVHRTCRPGYC
jgi:hypothetical protein